MGSPSADPQLFVVFYVIDYCSDDRGSESGVFRLFEDPITVFEVGDQQKNMHIAIHYVHKDAEWLNSHHSSVNYVAYGESLLDSFPVVTVCH